MISELTVLDTTLELFRKHGITTIFGNPGSNEIPFLAGLTEDFEFILGLHEQVVVGMAEGYARATGKPALVNLHAASGSGNAMGALTNAHYGHIPMVVLAGQQVRRTVGQEAFLGNVDASMLPQPLVKYSHEPLAPEDVTRTLSQGILEATTKPQGPVYISVPLDDWAEPTLADDPLLYDRSVSHERNCSGLVVEELSDKLENAEKIALVLGPQVDAEAVQDPTVFDALEQVAEYLNASVFVAPSPSRCPFPTTHPNFKGVLVPGIKSVRDSLADYDTVLVLGAPVFRYHRWEPSNYLADGTDILHVTQDAREATRAPFGRSFIADVGAVSKGLAQAVKDRGIRRGERGSRVVPQSEQSSDGMSGSEIIEVLNRHVNETVVYVNETTSLDLDYLERIVIDRPGMYNFPASGGLGFGLPAAVGMSIAGPDKTVVATVGDGSAHFGISALYTAAQRQTRTIFIIVNNSGYGALAGFSKRMGAENVPGLKIGGIDLVSIAEGYGVSASRVSTVEELERDYCDALATTGPVLIDAHVI